MFSKKWGCIRQNYGDLTVPGSVTLVKRIPVLERSRWSRQQSNPTRLVKTERKLPYQDQCRLHPCRRPRHPHRTWAHRWSSPSPRGSASSAPPGAGRGPAGRSCPPAGSRPPPPDGPRSPASCSCPAGSRTGRPCGHTFGWAGRPRAPWHPLSDRLGRTGGWCARSAAGISSPRWIGPGCEPKITVVIPVGTLS